MRSYNNLRTAGRASVQSRSRRGIFSLTLLLPLFFLSSCGGSVDESAKTELVAAGFDAPSAAELSKLGLSSEEIGELKEARRGGLDGTAAVKVVKALHDDDLKFDLGTEMQTLSGAGFTATALVQLVEIGAVRGWESDLRVMKYAGIGEATIVMIARRHFSDKKKDVLSGNEYADLKSSGISDLGIEAFVKKGGTPQQLQKVQQSVRMGESEQAALQKAGL